MRTRVLVVAALCLTSAAALATPSGHKWFLSNGIPSYKVFNHSSIPGIASFSTVLTPIQTSYSRWSSGNVSCSAYQVNYGGTFTIAGCTNPNTNTACATALNGSDGKNQMIWLGGVNWTQSNSTLGVTRTSWYQGSGELFDADMEMNNNLTWKLSGTAPTYDVESITTHEAGHWAGLDHTTNTAAVMTPFYNQGDIKRQLDTLDVNDICSVYPQSAPTGTQGSACTANSNCSATATPALKCWSTSSTTPRICSRSCTADTDCAGGLKCQNAVDSAGATGKACLAPSGAPDLCKFCSDGTQCSTGVCVGDGQHSWCSLACTGSTQCGPNYTCNGGYCVPSSGTCNTQCTTASNCAVGYACVSGECEASGNVGDRCEVSVYCKSCGLCVGDQNEAYCRSCCGGQGLGGSCTACSSTTCATATTCTDLYNGSGAKLPDRVCTPTGGATSCGACAIDGDCQSGLSCYGGRCHATCNPGSANTCSQKACYGTSASTGVCACNDEIAYVGQACGLSGTNLKVCANNTVCVGTPKTCRAPCTTAAQCNQGETCSVLDGQSVCVSGNVAGTRCSSCNNGSCGSNADVCFSGRCRQYCNASSPACGECVAFSGDDGVCSCSDERQGPGGACGLVANVPFSCQSGLVCVEGTCRSQCPGGQTQCNPGYECTTNQLCIPFGSGGGSGGGAAGGGTGGGTITPGNGGGAGGGGSQQINSAGCGCGAGADAGGVMTFALGLLALMLRARRRS